MLRLRRKESLGFGSLGQLERFSDYFTNTFKEDGYKSVMPEGLVPLQTIIIHFDSFIGLQPSATQFP